MTATSILCNAGGNMALTAILTGNTWLSCHTSDPTDLGLPDTEVAGGGYLRQLIKWSSPNGKGVVSTNPQTFAGMPAVIVWGFGVWNAQAGGIMVARIPLLNASGDPAPITVQDTAAFMCAAGDIGLLL